MEQRSPRLETRAAGIDPAGVTVDEWVAPLRNLVIEQIVSGDVAPTAYTQRQDEWVVVLAGGADLDGDGETATSVPGTGSCCRPARRTACSVSSRRRAGWRCTAIPTGSSVTVTVQKAERTNSVGSGGTVTRVVTISASYGAGGSVVAPALAERLGLPFFDRLLHGPDTRSPEHIIERLSEEERQQTPPSRVIANLGHMSAGLGFPVPMAADLDPLEAMLRRVETSIRRIARGTGGVILGRGAAVVLADQPTVFNVRLDGPIDRRAAQGAAIEGVEIEVARAHQADADKAWSQFGQRVFHRDFRDARLYNIVLDSTALPLADCVGLVASAATAYWRHNGCG